MKVSYFERATPWKFALRFARTTVHKADTGKEPSSAFKEDMARSEHSPLRCVYYAWEWQDIPYWVSVHFVRHKFGIEHFVSTQRTDRTGIPREGLPQNEPVIHGCFANAQAIINISRKRLCQKASPETRHAWMMVLEELEKVDPELAKRCVPECIYRGMCPEPNSCGWWDRFMKKVSKRRSTDARASEGPNL